MDDDSAGVPVIIGVGQFSERLGTASYDALPPAEIAARAAAAALADAGIDGSVVDVVAATRQFDESIPGLPAALGRPDNFPRAVARRVGADPVRAIYEISGGQSPQSLVTELAGEVAAGRARVGLVVGAEAISTVTALSRGPEEERPDFTEEVGGQLEDRGYGLTGLVSRYGVDHGLADTTGQYALFENARRSRLGLSRAEHAATMGRLFAPFTEVAARNPHSAAPVERTAEELVTVTDDNRVVADPYPKHLVSREKVNQGGAVLVTTEAVATELGIARERWVHLHGHADVREQPLLARADLSAAPGSVRAVRVALEMAGIGLDDLATLDLYSCYPIAVTALADGLGLAHDDPRGLTLTGGLPYFGGAGNGYSLHAIAETVERARSAPGSYGLVGANGGVLSKYSVGIYSTAPAAWQPGRDDRLQAEVDALPEVEVALDPDGWGTVETWTVGFGRDGRRTPIVVGRLPDGRRFLANAAPGDEELADRLLGDHVVAGTPIYVRSHERLNRATLTEERMDELVPRAAVGFRDDYEHVRVHRDGHLLEVTIDRPQARNALTPQANQELSDVFDAYLADPDLWVAILTGADVEGDRQAFCAGNDLRHTASGARLWMPRTGFAGLTGRTMTKPVIAAVNGFALGGGFEIALACHVVVADEGATFGLTEVHVGLVAAAGGLVRLPRAVPPHVAHELVLTGRRITAAEAERWGIVSRVAPRGEVMTTARELAAEILTASPTSVRLSLEMMAQAAAHADPVAALEAPSDALDQLMVSHDALEGITAFVSKRSPAWKNR